MIVFVLACILGMFVFRYVKRLNDPMDYAALDVAYEPRLSTARFEGLRTYDPVSYDAGIAAIREFSRQYQSSHLAETDPRDIVTKMTSSRRKMHREFHSLRSFLPNNLSMNRNVLAGIEETDARMEDALAEVSRRFPEVRLLHSAGRGVSVVRGVDDDWD